MVTEIDGPQISDTDVQQPDEAARDSRNVHGVGSVYTPAALAEWTGAQLLRYVTPRPVLRILDPACGDGELLEGVARIADQRIEASGRDIDAGAIACASKRLAIPVDLAVGDSLTSATLSGLEHKPDGIIVNPPWGRPNGDLRGKLQEAGYELAQGQFDLYEIFIERMIKSFPDTPMAFILPDSIFLPEHTRLRRFLLEHATILFLARLGEGLFPDVFRGAVVLVLRSSACEGVGIECLRLGHNERAAFLGGDVSLEAIRALHSHIVPQERFASNPNVEFTIDIRAGETAIDKMLTTSEFEWDRWLVIGRGVEIGKSGATLRCDACGEYRVMPMNGLGADVRCRRCDTAFCDKSTVHQIVRPLGDGLDPMWRPMIVGEDLDRYRCEPTREVLMGVSGIRYPDTGVLERPKLLVRKTGVGIRSAVDLSGAITIQTVYHFVPRGDFCVLLPFYLAGVLNSRVMLAFHLKWSGENEWRSHPYVTQRIIKGLPVPNPLRDERTLTSEASEIAALARRRSELEMVEEQIDELVMDLFGLNSEERQWTNDVIESAQTLRGIAEMQSCRSVSR